MIRYEISDAELRARITAESATWLQRAATKTQSMSAARAYSDGAPNWSDIKPVFVDLQHKKCAYCEKYIEAYLEGTDNNGATTRRNVGAVEQDIEHYRPKSEVKPWGAASEVGRFTIRDGRSGGYYLLAYNIWNYCVSCKTCNSTLKGNWFPIAGRAGSQREPDVEALNDREEPYLIYPIGNIDDNPERILTFRGIHPIPKTRSGKRNRRAKVTIRFFQLDTRENLMRQRSAVIIGLDSALELLNSRSAQRRADAERDVERYLHASSDHCNCARAYFKLYLEDPDAAYSYVTLARNLLGEPVDSTN